MATVPRLWKRIEESRIQATTKRYFLPQVKLREIFTQDAIAESVNELSIAREDRIGLVPKIFHQSITIFAILLWMRKENTIVQFRQHGVLDTSLPLSVEQACEIVPEFGRTLAGEVQWEFIPYRFPKDMSDCHVIMRSQAILPFVNEEFLTGGGFGDVFEMKVVASQQEFFAMTNGGDPVIVRKRLKPQLKTLRPQKAGQEPHEEEMTCLRLLHRLKHPNIVKLLGSYTYQGEHNFLFPRVEQDLSDFFDLDHRPKAFEGDHTFFGALFGLASALENVHVLNLRAQEHGVEMSSIGYHHDLRPENVLIEGNSFLLADFGLSKIKDRTEVSVTDWKAGAGDYIAPECMDNNLAHQRVGRSIDVWAFGCLVTEVLTYLELGKPGLDEFRRRRASSEVSPNWEDSYFFSKDGVRQAVSQWLRTLASKAKNFLTADGVEVVFWMLQIDPRGRPTASKMAQRLSILSIRAHFFAAKHAFMGYLEAVQGGGNEQISFMKSWFEKERLNALETLLGSSAEDSTVSSLLQEVKDLHNRSRSLFIALLGVLKDDHRRKTSDESNENEIRVLDLGQSIDVEVQIIVQKIWELFPVKYQRRMEFAWRQKSFSIDDAQQLCKDGQRPGTLGSPHYDELSALVAMRALRLQFLNRETGDDSSEKYILHYDDVDANSEEEMYAHATCVYKGQRVLVEWEYYSSKWDKVPSKAKAELMALKAEGLGVTPKPPALKILDCLGFLESLSGRHGHGFLYAFPSAGTGRLTSLSSLLVQDMREGKMQRQPLLSGKFHLAATLATCLFELHTVGWLHENINSNNIVFFNAAAKDPSSSPTALYDPYLVDFRFSRPDSQVCFTLGPVDDEYVDYRHPSYNRGSRFRRVYDYYSLGVVLLELGLWNPLSYIVARYRTASPEELRDVLVDKYVPRLGPRMGLIYRDAVISCLSRDSGTSDTDDASEMRDFAHFAEKVVEPLEALGRLSL